MEEKKKGGSRQNAGRKKVNDKKVQFVVYIPKSWIPEKSGDAMRLREKVVDFIEETIMPVKTSETPQISSQVSKKVDVPKNEEASKKATEKALGDDIQQKIEELRKEMEKCGTNFWGKKMRDSYQKQIDNLKKQ